MKTLILALITSLCIACGAAAAESLTWISLGGGGAASPSSGMPGGRLGVHWWQGKGLWTATLAGYEEVDILGTVSPHENVVDCGVMYGGRWGGRVGFVSMRAGLSVLSGVRHGQLLRHTGWIFGTDEYEAKHFTTVGVPIEVELALVPFENVGIALGGFVNFNPECPLKGATLSLLLGQVR